MNDSIQHAYFWSPIPAKLLYDIPKFDCKHGQYHLWCSSNSLMDDSIYLRILQLNLTITVAKWYIELLQHYGNFSSLSMEFLKHFQLPICYEIGTNLLTSLRQSTST